MADGDGRALLNLIEQVMAWNLSAPIDSKALGQRLMKRAAQYDKSGRSEEHTSELQSLTNLVCRLLLEKKKKIIIIMII